MIVLYMCAYFVEADPCSKALKVILASEVPSLTLYEDFAGNPESVGVVGSGQEDGRAFSTFSPTILDPKS